MMSRNYVLVVDDNKDTLDGIVKVLRFGLEGTKVIGAAHPRTALDMLADQEVHVVVTDFKMPEMNGMEFLEAIQDRPVRGRILITAYRKDAEAVLAGRSGAIHRYMRKPLDADHLVDSVKELMGPRHMAAADNL